jgi:ferric-dicitrate binding protein FerR (iron transport regulator)
MKKHQRLVLLKNVFGLRTFFIYFGCLFFFVSAALAQEDMAFRAVRVKGDVTAYHNENDETARLYTSQAVDDGDKVTTAKDSEVVLRTGSNTYLYLEPRTKIHFIRLRQGDKGSECQINLVTGRMLCQLEQAPQGAFEVSAGNVVCREHGTLFEISRNGDDLTVVAYTGAVVANFHGKTKMAKDNEVLKLSHGKFQNKTHHLTTDQQGHLQAWQGLLAEISK